VTASSAAVEEETEPAAAETTPPAGDEENSITSLVFGWVENVLSLLFKPQDDFIA